MERRTERKIQKERENEGDEFKDKESFITPAYQAKLEERKQQEAEERIKEQMEGRAFFLLFQNWAIEKLNPGPLANKNSTIQFSILESLSEKLSVQRFCYSLRNRMIKFHQFGFNLYELKLLRFD